MGLWNQIKSNNSPWHIKVNSYKKTLDDTLKNLPNDPGIYQMMDSTGKVIYVGKANNLHRRVNSYFSRKLDTKTQTMIAKVTSIHVIITTDEQHALLLEAECIKSYKPHYNIVLRDDASY